ncbi:MAG: S9 family peptidase [Planctomycetes bacterium]|nr:S9 family peptidase [Planctomycetota bacterium]
MVDDYHGTPVADPYRWLEELGSAEVLAWAAAQNAVTSTLLAGDSLRDILLQRMEELARPWDELEPARPAAPTGRLRLAYAPSETGSARVVTVSSEAGGSRVLVNPREFGAAMEVARFDVSPDDRHVAYALSDAGSEWWQGRVRRVADGRDLPEVLEGMLWAAPVWTHDGAGFFYVRYGRPAPGAVTMFHSPAVMYHRAGTAQSDDRVIYRTPVGTTTLSLGVQLTPDGRYALVREGEGAHVEAIGWLDNRRWLLDLREPQQPDLSGPLVPLTPDRASAYELVGQRDSLFYLLTDHDAPRRRLVAVNPRNPDVAQWREVIPQHVDVLTDIRQMSGRWVATYMRDVQHHVRIFDLDGKPLLDLGVPPLSSVLELRAGPADSLIDLVTMSFLRPPSVTRHDLTTGRAHVIQSPALPFDTAAYEARQVWYAGKDGTRIPMFLMHRRGIALDGSHPTLLFTYGASAQVLSPAYGEQAIAWMELGGIVAAPGLRGGGEFGREWYEAAILERKQTTFDDAIAAAEWLIAQRYTTPARLAIRGASNGGLLVSAVIAQRPDLFAAAVAEVPGVDVLRFDYGRHRTQFGWAGDPAQFPFLLSYAPLQRIRAGTCYPATFISTALNDDRAPAWNALKLTAALQTAQGCARPVLLRVRDTGGHSGGEESWMEREVEILAFVARQLGLR